MGGDPMQSNQQQLFLKRLEEKLQRLGLKTVVEPGGGAPQIGDTLRTLLPTGEGEAVLMEFTLTSYDERSDLLHFYTTILMHMEGEGAPLRSALLEWNILCPLGAFGIFLEGGQFYHKYTLPVPQDILPETLAEQAMYLADLIMDVITDRYPEIVRLGGGANAPGTSQ